MRDRMRSRNTRRHARPGRGPFPIFTPGPAHHVDHKRHAELVGYLESRGLVLGELTELIDLRIRMGRAAAVRNSFGEVIV